MATKKAAFTAAETGESAVVAPNKIETTGTPDRGFPKGATRVLVVADDPDTFREGKRNGETVREHLINAMSINADGQGMENRGVERGKRNDP